MNATNPNSPNESEIDAVQNDFDPPQTDLEMPSQDEQLLVSYLDGELDAESVSALETRLTREDSLRLRLHALQKTWDMLDELPRTIPATSFIRSTIEMVVSSAKKKKSTWHRWPLRLVAMAVSFALMALLTFQIVRSIQNQPYRQFVQDMDFIENVYFYNEIEDIEFLERLHSEALFSEDLPDEI